MNREINSLDRINLLDFWPSNTMLDVWDEGMADFMEAAGVLIDENDDQIVLIDRYNEIVFSRLGELSQKAEREASRPGENFLEHIFEYFHISRKAFYERFIFLHSLALISSFLQYENDNRLSKAGENLKLFEAHRDYCIKLFEHAMKSMELMVKSVSGRLNELGNERTLLTQEEEEEDDTTNNQG